MKIWNDAVLTDPDIVLEDVGLSNIAVPTYLLFAEFDEACSYDKNAELLDAVGTVKRSITYEGYTHMAPFEADTSITTDVITILGSGAHSLVAAASVASLLSLL